MRHKAWLWIAIMIIVAIAIGYSGIGGITEGAKKRSESKEKVTISIWTLSSEWIKPAIDDFKTKYPNIDVELTLYDTDPIKETLRIAASTKTLPDIWFTFGGTLGSFYTENGLTMDLTQIAADHQWNGKYNKAALSMVTYGDKVSGIPFHMNVLGMWYPKSVYEKAGLKAPTTFEEFESQLQSLKDHGITPLALGNKGGWHTMRLTEQLLEHFAGPELHDRLNELTASWDDVAVVKTFEKLKEYTEKGYFPKGFLVLDSADAGKLIYKEQAGIVIEGTWFVISINNEGLDNAKFDVFPFPSDHTILRPSLFVDMFQINGESDPDKQDAAVLLGEYLTSNEVVDKYVEIYGAPAILNTTTSDKMPQVQRLLESSKAGGFLITDQALPQEVVQKLFEAQDKIALNEWTPARAAREMEKAAQAFKSKR